MTGIPRTASLVLALALLGTSGRILAQGRPSGVAGRVVGDTAPLSAAGVYAYELADASLHKVLTDPQGNFLFQNLPAGLYKVIAHKPGFLPVIILLTRTTAQAYQFLELQLAPQERPGREAPAGAGDGDFWSIRSRIPADVLRDIETPDLPVIAGLVPSGPEGLSRTAEALQSSTLARFHTEMQAMKGFDQTAELGGGQVSGERVGIDGHVGSVQVGFRGRFWQLSSDALIPHRGGSADGQASALSLALDPGPSSHIVLTSLNNRLTPRQETSGVTGTPVGLEHYQLSWRQALGEDSHSDFAAQYTSESNFHRQGPMGPADIPEASRTWRVEGSYTTSLSDSSTLQAGLRYRARQLVDLNLPSGHSGFAEPALGSDLDLFGRGGMRLAPTLLVEYGLYSTVRDGTVALTPQGGVVLQLGSGWQAEGSASHRSYQSGPLNPEFIPTLYAEGSLCEDAGGSCYELKLSRHSDDQNVVSLSAVERKVGQTLRLYFSDDFFDRLESLYLVPGDRFPEV
nr:carboxypeptidase-like regulatory domain-containing protein [Acidobacteriota bacterium]